MVSIMPGMDSRAPERTENRSGSRSSPKVLPICLSTEATPAFTSAARDAGYFFPFE